MKKYLFIIKMQIMSSLQYVFDTLFSFLGYFVMLYILFNLWKYLYSDPNEIINGYTMSGMTWYVIITEILWMTVRGRKLCEKISEDVKSGNITYNINKPYNYVSYALSNHLGEIFIKGIIYFLLGIITGYLFIGSLPNLNILNLLIVIITMILATVISILLIISLGLISFFIEDASPFYWVYSKIILVLGTIFPIEYFPKFMIPFLKFSPVFVVCYGPARLFVNFSYRESLVIIISQIIYIVISYLLAIFIYRKGVKRINVNGG